MASKRKSVTRNSDKYLIYTIDEIKLGEEARCPDCNGNGFWNPSTDLVQHGLFDDIFYEFMECNACRKRLCVVSTIQIDGDIPFDDFLASLQSAYDTIPF